MRRRRRITGPIHIQTPVATPTQRLHSRAYVDRVVPPLSAATTRHCRHQQYSTDRTIGSTADASFVDRTFSTAPANPGHREEFRHGGSAGARSKTTCPRVSMSSARPWPGSLRSPRSIRARTRRRRRRRHSPRPCATGYVRSVALLDADGAIIAGFNPRNLGRIVALSGFMPPQSATTARSCFPPAQRGHKGSAPARSQAPAGGKLPARVRRQWRRGAEHHARDSPFSPGGKPARRVYPKNA